MTEGEKMDEGEKEKEEGEKEKEEEEKIRHAFRWELPTSPWAY